MTAGLPGKGRLLRRSARPCEGVVLAVACVAALMLGACSGGGGGDTPAQQQPPAPQSSGNRAPTINGVPTGTVLVGQQFNFVPTASDADGNTLTFSIAGKPTWANFNTSTGQLTGTPGQGDVGTYANIRISVSDGVAVVNLASFGIQVTAVATASALVSWNPPTTNSDGSALTNLKGYNIYWGGAPDNYPNSTSLGVGVTSYVVEQLTPGTWYFVVTAVNAQGIESIFSNVASKTM